MPELEIKRTAKAVITDGREILMGLRAADDPNRPGQWDLLGGGGEPGDKTYKDIAWREVREESGLLIPEDDLVYFHTEEREKNFVEDNRRRLVRTEYYMGHVEFFPDDLRPSHEHGELRRFTLEAAIAASREYDRQVRVLKIVQSRNLMARMIDAIV